MGNLKLKELKYNGATVKDEFHTMVLFDKGYRLIRYDAIKKYAENYVIEQKEVNLYNENNSLIHKVLHVAIDKVCDNVDHFEFETLSRDMDGYWYDNGKSVDRDFLKKSCLDNLDLRNYIGFSGGYALHVAKGKVEPFVCPKDISDFHNIDYYKYLNAYKNDSLEHFNKVYEETKLKKAPQSWCYIEG